jgi:DNA-binding SARP family transcriptional activator
MPDPQTSIAALALQLFGPMQVRVQGQPLPPLRSRMILWLLALLPLRPNRPVEREWLSGVLWPDRDQSQAFANLRPVLSGLRSALGGEGERLQSPSRHILLLDLTGADVDVLEFDAAIASGDLSQSHRLSAPSHHRSGRQRGRAAGGRDLPATFSIGDVDRAGGASARRAWHERPPTKSFGSMQTACGWWRWRRFRRAGW